MCAQLLQARVGLPIERIGELHSKFPGASYGRYGGVLRIPSGDPLGRGGQIVAHLTDTPQFDAARVARSLQAVQHASQLATAFSGVAAVSGVLNLGVSVAGFAIMNRRLSRLSADLHDFRELAESRFDGLEQALETVGDRLVDLQLLTFAVRGELGELRADTREIGRLLDLDRFVRLPRILERLDAGDYAKNAQLVEHARDDLIELRHFFERAISEQPAMGGRLVRDLGYFQAWALTCATEGRLLRCCGQTRAAREVLTRNVERMLRTARVYAEVLLGACPADFLAPGLESFVYPEAFVRWVRHRTPTQDDDADILRQALDQRNEYTKNQKLSPSQYLASLDLQALRARAIAVERMLGVVERLDSFRSELVLCERQNLSMDAWERRPFEGSSSAGLYFTPEGE